MSNPTVDGLLKGSKAKKGHVGSNAVYYLYLIPGVVSFGLVAGGSFLYNAYLSFTKWNGLGKPEWIGMENYAKLMHDHTFWVSFLHAFQFIGAMSIVPTFLGLLVAALIYDFVATRFGNGMSTFLRISFYVPQIIALPVSGILWTWMLSPNIGVINTALRKFGLDSLALNWLGEPKSAIFAISVMMVWIQIGYTIVIFVSGMARLDPSLDEAGQLDGASWFQRFRIITVPQLYPELSIVLLTTTVAALKVFGPIYVMTSGGPGDSTQVPAFFSFFHFFTTQKVGYGAAVATILALILTVLAVVLLQVQKRLGATK